MPMTILLRTPFYLAAFFSALVLFAGASAYNVAIASDTREERQHLVFLQGTAQELEVFKTRGREKGPTVMILGGIHGDEPAAVLAADVFADAPVKKGTLIVVPRANFPSVMHHHRGPCGDMNRKFDDDPGNDPEYRVVEVLKSLMAESDLLLTLHEGSGFYRPTRESDMAGPNRYGQCVIADTDEYRRTTDGRVIQLQEYANSVVARLNSEITEPLYTFRFFNMRTESPDSAYKEHRMSATYYALSHLGIPAFCSESSKQLPTLEMKVRQHVLAVQIFLALFGLETAEPAPGGPKAALSHIVIAVNGLPLAAADGHTLLVSPGDSVEVLHIGATHDRGLSVEVQPETPGQGGSNQMNRPLVIDSPVTLLVRKDHTPIGKIRIDFPSKEHREETPQLLGTSRIGPAVPAMAATLDMLPGTRLLAEAAQARQLAAATEKNPPENSAPEPAAGKPAKKPDDAVTAKGPVSVFLFEVDGAPVAVKPGETLTVMSGSLVKIVDMKPGDRELPKGVVMNLRGFIAEKDTALNTGEDRGAVADTAKDMLPAFSEGRKGEVYPINAEVGKDVLASCFLRLEQPKLAAVTLRVDGKTHVLTLGSRTRITAGTKVELLEVKLKGDRPLSRPRFTLAGHPFSAKLPQSLTMRDIAINLAIFNGDVLAGKVTWVPK